MKQTGSNPVIERIEQDFEPDHVGRVLRYLAQPSISALNLGVRQMAQLLTRDIREFGGRAEVVETAQLPVVFGRINEGAEKTLLLHGLYDVTPAEEPGWVVSPFEPEIRDVNGVGRSVVGRGAEDIKTPIAAAINGWQVYRATGRRLPREYGFPTQGDWD